MELSVSGRKGSFQTLIYISFPKYEPLYIQAGGAEMKLNNEQIEMLLNIARFFQPSSEKNITKKE